MTAPIRVYKTVTPGRYILSSDRVAGRFTPRPGHTFFCARCGRILRPDAAPHWQIAARAYCSNCVEVIDPQEVVG